MRFIKLVPSSRRKNRKNHFTVSFHIRRRLISGSLSKDLKQKYNVRSVSKNKDGEVQLLISCSMGKLEYKRLFVDVRKVNKLIKLLKCTERKMLSLKVLAQSSFEFVLVCFLGLVAADLLALIDIYLKKLFCYSYRYTSDLNVLRFFLDHNSKT
uniref:Uncharacterized protein n=1 Tax=Vespula pensylvanica TaxID=30213 RepID=A0A834K0M0_VESPE|nr:hypothetical protein H0235_016674 [Vespula pensylvanica]